MQAQQDPSSKVWPGKPTTFRKYHDVLVRFFQIPAVDRTGVTPASHRGGGATHLFFLTNDVTTVQWRGRWRSIQTLRVYLQELQAPMVLARLDPQARRRIDFFANAAPALLDAFSC